MPYANNLLSEEDGSRIDFILAEAGAFLQTLLVLPRRMESALGKIERDELGVRIPGLDAQLGSIDLTLRRMLYALIFTALLLSGVQLQLGGEILYARLFFAGSLLVLVGILFARPIKKK